MAVPSSGELKLWDTIWNQELGGTQGENSLHSASVYAGFSTPDAMSDFYGWSDVEVPTVTSTSMGSISYNAMRACGNVSNTGNENPTRGFYFGTSTNRTSNAQYSVGVGGTGAFCCYFTGLTYNRNYYGWAYACNSAGLAAGNRIDGTTPYPPFSPTYQFTNSLFVTIGGALGWEGCTSFGYFQPYTGAYCTLCDASKGNVSNYDFTHTSNQGAPLYAPNGCGFIFNARSRQFAYANPSPANCFYSFRSNICACFGPYSFTQGCGISNFSASCVFNQTLPSGGGKIQGLQGYTTAAQAANACFCIAPSDIRLKTNINYL